MRRINLLFVITKLELGGAQKQLLGLAARLDQSRYRIFLVTSPGGFLLPDASRIPGITVKETLVLRTNFSPINDLLAVREIAGFIRAQQIDIVHTHSSKAGVIGRLAARLAGVKCIVHTVHGWSFYRRGNPLASMLYLFLERLAGSFTGAFIVTNAHDQEQGVRRGIGKASQYQRIPYGIEEIFFQSPRSDIRNEFGITLEEPIVTDISCFKPQKACLDFLRFASILSLNNPKVRFILVGDGALRPAIEKYIREHNLSQRVILTGWRGDIPEILSATDVLVLTSLWEGLPVSILEAMASGVAVVAADTGGVRDIVKDNETGFLVEPGDTASLGERVKLLLEDSALRRRLGEAARRTVKVGFTFDQVNQQTDKLYTRLLKLKGVQA